MVCFFCMKFIIIVVILMKNRVFCYYLFLFLSSFARGLVNLFSLVLLYKNGFSLHNILFFLLFTYLIGMVVCFFSLKMNKRIILFFSNFLYGISFLFLSNMSCSFFSLLLFSVLFSTSNYSYHVIRHYYAFYMLNERNTSFLVMIMYLGVIFSSFIGSLLLNYLSVFFMSVILLVLSLVSCIPIFFCHFPNQLKNDSFLKEKERKKIKLFNVSLDIRKFFFSILEQFKVLFLELQPLFLYLYVKSSYLYIGIFNVIMNLSSLFFVFLLVKHLSIKKFKYVTVLLGIILFFKIYLRNNLLLFIIAVLEGCLVKIYEMFSLDNLYYGVVHHIENYLIVEEFIFLFTKSIIILLFIVLNVDLKIMLYICIVGIMFSGFLIV